MSEQGDQVNVTLSYEEKIINALSRVEHKRTDSGIDRDKKDFDAIRVVLQPLYAELNTLRARMAELETLNNANRERAEKAESNSAEVFVRARDNAAERDRLAAENRAMREALQAAVDLLNSSYAKRAFSIASIHGFDGSSEEFAMVKETWTKIETALSATTPEKP